VIVFPNSDSLSKKTKYISEKFAEELFLKCFLCKNGLEDELYSDINQVPNEKQSERRAKIDLERMAFKKAFESLPSISVKHNMMYVQKNNGGKFKKLEKGLFMQTSTTILFN
jgi:hypothetical protein